MTSLIQLIQKLPRKLRWALCSSRYIQEWVDLALELNRSQWVFLVGVNNSGTTLAAQLIGSHPMIQYMAPEGQHVSKAFPSATKLGVPRLWTERLDAFRWDGNHKPALALRAMYDWSYYLSPGPYLLEKSPTHCVRVPWLERNFNSPYFIAIVRDPYAVCEGIRRRDGYCIERAARHWATANQILMDDLDHIDRKYVFKYEDLCQDPYPILDAIRSLLQLDIEFDRQLPVKQFNIHNTYGVPERILNFNSKSHSRLSAADIDIVNRTAGEVIERLGYPKLDSRNFKTRVPSA